MAFHGFSMGFLWILSGTPPFFRASQVGQVLELGLKVGGAGRGAAGSLDVW